jgi:ribonuclease HII
MIEEYALEYPEYGLAENKGYGTRQHMDAILEHGPTKLHRLSFLRGLEATQN